VYDPLNRLTEANYSNNDYYHYAYDAVGNRLTQDTFLSGLLTNTTYVYDDANRLTGVNGVTYTWDNNGNLLNDGVNTYAYDSANRLKAVSNQSTVTSYAYNGLNDRLRETVNGDTTTFTMDLNTGLTQALSDGANTYIYGNGRIAQVTTATEYFLGDALGSVRQLTNASGTIAYARAYDPYGVVTSTNGSSQSTYSYTGEYSGDSTQLLYLRARHYAPYLNQFIQPDTIVPNPYQPMDWNKYLYVRDNPINYTDPSGFIPCSETQDTNVNRYCVLNRGGYIDVEHFKYKKEKADSLIKIELPSQFGKTFGQIPFSGSLGGPLPPTHFATYYTRFPKDGLPKDQLGRIALGIMLDYEHGFETAQGIDPRCWSIAGLFSHCSSFSNEDLPSDYLGIVSAVKGLSLEEMLMPNLLGSGEQSDRMPAGYWGMSWQLFEPARCSWGFCPSTSPFNDQCTFKVFDSEALRYSNQSWPSALLVEPFGYRTYWARNISDFTNFALPVPIAP
jgi:RHS repeat-associated protein